MKACRVPAERGTSRASEEGEGARGFGSAPAQGSALALKRGIPVFSIDPTGTQPAPHIDVLAEWAEMLIPRVVDLNSS